MYDQLPPESRVSLRGVACTGAPECRDLMSQVRENLLGRYIGFFGDPPRIQAAVIDLDGLDIDIYRSQVRHKYKGNSVREAAKAERSGFYVRIFPRELFIPDIHDVNHSLEVRCGRPMGVSYQRNIEELGGFPTQENDSDEFNRFIMEF